MSGVRRFASGWVGLAAAWLLVGCGSTAVNRAPVEDRGGAAGTPSAVTDARTLAVKQPPGFENAGKAGYITVKPGDTLMRIGLESGQSHKDIARWNALDNPNKIEVGQVLRVVPPKPETPVIASTKPVQGSSAVSTPLAASSAAQPVAKNASAPVASASAVPGNKVDDIDWVWPTNGSVANKFEEAKNGVDFSGAEGDPVFAAADGKVIVAEMGEGSMRNYGNLIILKHGENYITAYANNHSMLVKEGQFIKRGQKIAAMGSSGTDKVKLHFELRRQGKPVDPTKYLPAR